MKDLEDKIQELSEKELKLIDSAVCLTTTKEEENIFHQGFYSGYKTCMKKSYTEEEVIELMQKSITYGTHLEAGAVKVNYKIDYRMDWIKKNLK